MGYARAGVVRSVCDCCVWCAQVMRVEKGLYVGSKVWIQGQEKAVRAWGVEAFELLVHVHQVKVCVVSRCYGVL